MNLTPVHWPQMHENVRLHQKPQQMQLFGELIFEISDNVFSVRCVPALWHVRVRHII